MTIRSLFRWLGSALKAIWSPECKVCCRTIGSNTERCDACLEHWQDRYHGI